MTAISLDLTDAAVAGGSKNKTALTGACTMNLILAIAYLVELLKGTRSVGSYLFVAALCILPCAISLAIYFRQKDAVSIRYICSIGFSLLYSYVMFTTTTDLSFCYAIVMFVIMIVYTDKKLSIGLGVYTFLINIAVIAYKAMTRGLTPTEITDAEITVACIALSCVFTILGVSKMATIDQAGVKKAQADKQHSEELLQLTLKVADAVAHNIENVSSSTGQLKGSIATTQTAMEDLSNGTSSAASAIMVQQQNTAQINDLIDSVSTISQELMDGTDKTAQNLNSSKDVMENLIQQVIVSETSSTLVADSMKELNEYADKMQNIMALISNVASQTGLLSLNASIEAARAGEAGRGFAVVASEISSLASQTNAATGDINQLIDNITNSLSSVMETVHQLFESNQLQNQYITSAADYFSIIEENTKSTVSDVTKLKETVDAVSSANREIIDSIENVSAITQEVTASANTTLSGCRANLTSIEDISAIMKQLRENAEELQRH